MRTYYEKNQILNNLILRTLLITPAFVIILVFSVFLIVCACLGVLGLAVCTTVFLFPSKMAESD
jgi:hypothetical protein